MYNNYYILINIKNIIERYDCHWITINTRRSRRNKIYSKNLLTRRQNTFSCKNTKIKRNAAKGETGNRVTLKNILRFSSGQGEKT